MGGYNFESIITVIFFYVERSLSMGNEFLMYWAYPFPIYIHNFHTSLSDAVYAWQKGALEWSWLLNIQTKIKRN